MAKFSTLPGHISLILGGFSRIFGISLFLVGLLKTLYNLPNFAISDLAMSGFGLLVATLLGRKSFAGFMHRLSTPKGENLLLLISLIVSSSIFAIKLVMGGSDFYENFLGENSVVEWLTALFLLFSAYVALVAGLSKESPFPKWVLLAFASIFFIGCMEELSWGQMIFFWDTPASFRPLNSQGETTLHNIRGINNLINPALLLFSSTLSAIALSKNSLNIPLLGNRLLRFSRGLFPMLFLATIICAVVILDSRIVFLGRIAQDIEWAEFLISFSTFMHCLFLIAQPAGKASN